MNVIFLTGIPDTNRLILKKYPEMVLQAELNELEDLAAHLKEDTDVVFVNGYLDRETSEDSLQNLLMSLRRKNSSCRFIVIVPEADDSFRRSMASIAIYDVIEPDESGQIDEAALLEIIDTPRTEIDLTKRAPVSSENGIKAMFGKFEMPFWKKSRKIKVIGKQIFVFWSPLPRGKSTLAAHSALYMAQKTLLKIVLADVDPFKPDMERFFPLNPEKGFSDALELIQEHRADYEHIDRCLTPHPKLDKLDILFGHRHIQDFYQAKTEHYEKLMERLLIRRDVLVMDVHSVYDFSATDAALRMANTVYVPVRADKRDIERVNGYIQAFRVHGDYDARKFQLVVNEYGAMDMTYAEVEAVSDLKVAAYIPWATGLQRKHGIDNKVLNSMNGLELLERK